MTLSDEQRERYARNILIEGFGEEGQRALLDASVLIVGAGGLGSPAALYLAAAGVGRIGICDADAVELTNLQRQILHAMPDIGKPKVQSAAARISALNPEVIVEAHALRLTDANAPDVLMPYDFIIDATDNYEAKFVINDACVRLGKPFSHGSVVRFQGQAMTYVPGKGPCYRCIFEQPPKEGALSGARDGIIGAAAGLIGTWQALEAIKYLTGTGELLCAKLLAFDALYNDFRLIPLAGPNPTCPVCAAHGGR